VTGDPLIQQRVAGAGVETSTALFSIAGNQVMLAMPRYSQWRDELRVYGKAVMKCRHERRALAASRQVACTEIGHGRNAGNLGNDRWIADLPVKGYGACGQ